MLRTRETDGNGTLDETLYALQDANWHVVALADTSGAIVERFLDDPFARPYVLDDDFTADSDGLHVPDSQTFNRRGTRVDR